MLFVSPMCYGGKTDNDTVRAKILRFAPPRVVWRREKLAEPGPPRVTLLQIIERLPYVDTMSDLFKKISLYLVRAAPSRHLMGY